MMGEKVTLFKDEFDDSPKFSKALSKFKQIESVEIHLISSEQSKKLTTDGFDIDSNYLKLLYEKMNQVKANFTRMVFSNCRTLGGVDLVITLRKGRAPFLELFLRKIGLIT